MIVAAVWGTELIQFLAALANCTRTIWRIGLIAPVQFEERDEFILFFKSSWCKIARAAWSIINCVPQAAATAFALSSVFILLLCKYCSAWSVSSLLWIYQQTSSVSFDFDVNTRAEHAFRHFASAGKRGYSTCRKISRTNGLPGI